MPEPTDNQVSYPHQVTDEVTHEDLAAHFAENPDAYHEGLHPHVEKMVSGIGDSALDETVQDPDHLLPAHTETPQGQTLEPAAQPNPQEGFGAGIEVGQLEDIPGQSEPERTLEEIKRIIYDHTDDDTQEKLTPRDAEKLIDAGEPYAVTSSLDKFRVIDHQAIADRFIDAGKDYFVFVNNLHKFQDLSSATADKLINQGYANDVGRNLDRFQVIDRQAVADKLIDDGASDAILRNLHRFQGINHQALVDKLIDVGAENAVLKHFSKFESIDYRAVAGKLMDTQQGTEYIVNHLQEFHRGLGEDNIEKLIRQGAIKTYYVDDNNLLTNVLLENLDVIPGAEHQAIAERLAREPILNRSVLANLDKFEGIDKQAVINAVISVKEGEDAVMDNLDKLEAALHQATAIRLIEAGYGWRIARRIGEFQNTDHNAVAEAILAKNKAPRDLVENLDKFQGIDHNALADRLFGEGVGWMVGENFEKFQGLDHQQTVDRLFDAGFGGDVAKNFHKFQGLDATVVDRLIEQHPTYVADNLKNFHDLSTDAAIKILASGGSIKTAQRLGSFANPAEILHLLSDEMQANVDLADAVIENIGSVPLDSEMLKEVIMACASHYSTRQKINQLDWDALGLDEAAQAEVWGGSDNDIDEDWNEEDWHDEYDNHNYIEVQDNNPYEEAAGNIELVTITRPGTELHKNAVAIRKWLRNGASEGDDTYDGWTGVNLGINASFQDLCERIESTHGSERAREILGGTYAESKGKSSIEATYRRLAADYIALHLAEAGETLDALQNPERLGEIHESLFVALSDANFKFEHVIETDIPYYDKLFAEWDAKRMGEKDFQEVFLGRDGVYAYIGRRAQLHARRQVLGFKNNKQLAMPTYLVYPRGFRDGLDDETKADYLAQHISDPESAHYYDTGFTGTIPQDIMRVLGLSQTEWDERIRLLSASKRDRTVLGLKGDKDERDQIVNTVEHNVKDEDSAAGLYRDGERLRPYAVPTRPAERLAFAMVQQALHRYYYTQEMQQLKAAEKQVHLEAKTLQNAEMRLTNGLSEAQQSELVSVFDTDDIGKRLQERAQTIKIADSNDPYPDEAVFELPLNGTEGVIVKSVVTGKQHGPLDEFEALLLLERLGINAPKPLARVFTEGQRGFIVMNKLPGVSGRSIKNYFEEQNLSEEERKDILGQANAHMTILAMDIRSNTGLDKPWRLKDFMIEIERDEAGEPQIKSMLPIDFERAKVFDPQNPHSIKLGQDLDRLLQ